MPWVSKEHLTYLRDTAAKYYVFRGKVPRWRDEIREAQARAWDEGFDAGEIDVWEHDKHDWENPCITNPYRSIHNDSPE